MATQETVSQDSLPDFFFVAYKYTICFYPIWLTYTQRLLADSIDFPNRLGGPATMGPEDKMVVAMNDDTLYAQAFLDLSKGPQVLTIPAYNYAYSILQLDMFGTVLNISSSSVMDTTIPGNPTGVDMPGGNYVLYTGSKPDVPGIDNDNYILMPCDLSTLIIRADKYKNNGTGNQPPQYTNIIKEASEFRANLQLQPASGYSDSNGKGRASIAPLFPFYAPSVKMMADEAARLLPGSFIATLQDAVKYVANDSGQQLNPAEQQLSKEFNSKYNDAKAGKHMAAALTEMFRGVQAAHAALVNYWHLHKSGSTNNWIHFDNIGNWGDSGTSGKWGANATFTDQDYLDRASLNEYIQYGNDSSTCFYAHVFADSNNMPLNGAYSNYTITFNTQPGYERFWSITAYTPEAIELVDNQLNKYVVASYTPGLVIDTTDGKVTIYVQNQVPTAENTANWLPVPKGPFNLMLRIYGPTGTATGTAASPATYVPPPVVRYLPGQN